MDQVKLVAPEAESEELFVAVAALPKTKVPVGAFTREEVPDPRWGVGASVPPGMVAAEVPLKFQRARVSRTKGARVIPTIWVLPLFTL